MGEDGENNSKNSDFWMIRPCEMYNNEYKDCTSVKSRLHQYFIHGHTVDCNNWFEDYSLCLKWRNNKDLHAAESLIQSEKMKVRNRWKLFYANNIWETRSNPPENWNDPLPEYIAKRRSNSILKDTLGEYSEENSKSFCSIM